MTRAKRSIAALPIKSPGIYTLTTGTDTYKVAVNLPSADADVRQIDDDSLKKSWATSISAWKAIPSRRQPNN